MREANRKAFLTAVSADPDIKPLPSFKFSRYGVDALLQLPDVVRRAIGETFRAVGGKGELGPNTLERFVKRLGSDDSLLIDGDEFVVEYDEPQHFTTYRRTTLASSLYERLRVGFDPGNHASLCASVSRTGTSGFDHNDSAHRAFECPGVPGDCRHRQRAFYDFLKDVLLGVGLNGIPRLIRISDREPGTSESTQAAVDLLRRRASRALKKR